jgi:hypothetical protein
LCGRRDDLTFVRRFKDARRQHGGRRRQLPPPTFHSNPTLVMNGKKELLKETSR